MTRGLQPFSCEDRLRELALFILDSRGAREEHTPAFQFVTGAYKKDGERLFTGQGAVILKCKEGRFSLDIRKKFFGMKRGEGTGTCCPEKSWVRHVDAEKL